MGWSDGLKGAGGGALAGASIGGPWGAAVGGVIGGIGGLLGNSGPSEDEQRNRQMMMDYYNKVQGREAPQMGPAAQSATSSFRQNQQNLIGHLEGMSNGQGPSLAAQQLKAATDRNMSGQQAFANSGRGGPLAAMQAANNSARLGAQSAQDSAGARIQEQQMALNQLGLTLHGARGMDEENSRFNAGQTNDASQANMLARLKTMGLNDEQSSRLLQQMSGNSQSEAVRPGLGDQILAGGAGMYAMGTAQRAGNIRNPKPLDGGWSNGQMSSYGQGR